MKENDLSNVKIGDTLYSYQHGEVEVISTCHQEVYQIACVPIGTTLTKGTVFTVQGLRIASDNHPDLFLSHTHMIKYMQSLQPQQAIIVDLSKVKVGDKVWHWSHGEVTVKEIDYAYHAFPICCKGLDDGYGYGYVTRVNAQGKCLEYADNPIIFENVYQYNDYKNTECNK